MARSGWQDPHLTDRLVRALQLSGLSQNEVARKLGVSQSTASDWFSLEHRIVPSGEFLLRLPDILGVEGQWLLFGHGAMHAPPARDASREQVHQDGIKIGVRETIAAVRETLAQVEAETGHATPPATPPRAVRKRRR